MAIGMGLVKAGFRPVPWLAYVPEVALPDDPAYRTMRLIDPYGETMFSSFNAPRCFRRHQSARSRYTGRS